MAKVPFSKGQGACIFCGSPGLTKEHIWADWLRAHIPRTQSEHLSQFTKSDLDGDEEKIFRHTGDPHSRRIRCVCGSCNNGWMSRLQETAKPFLVPMLTGNPTVLHRRAQTVLSAWTAVMVAVSEHQNPEVVAIPKSDRSFLRDTLKPPRHWRIWIGFHDRVSHPLYSHRVLPFATEEEFQRLGGPGTPGTINTQTTTVCVGQHLIVHVMSSEIAWSIIRRWKLPGYVSPALTQIWPIRASTVAWPTRHALTDAGIGLLSEEFFNKARALLIRRRGY